MNRAPIGVFDSGIGGLSVARELRRRLPGEDYIYLADTAYCPYGVRPLEEIRERSVTVVGELVDRGAKLVVVACNTASGAALETLRATFTLPIVGLEPAVKPATLNSRTGRVGVIATRATLASGRYQRLVDNYGRGVQVIPLACPGLVDLVESGQTEGPEVEAFLADALSPLIAADIDTLVLGCTHYPFVRPAIAGVMGPDVVILDSGEAVARQVERVLREADALAPSSPQGRITLLTTGDRDQVAAIVNRMWGEPIEIQSVGQLLSTGGPSVAESSR